MPRPLAAPVRVLPLLLCALAAGSGLGCKSSGSAGGMMAALAPTPQEGWNIAPVDQEDYDHIDDNDFVAVADQPLSTFSVDVDTASYSNTRRFLAQGRLPPADAVRIEELVNYFEYEYAEPADEHPFSVTAEIGPCPWNDAHRLVHLGIQGKHVHQAEIPPRNLVFLVDVSGSMDSPDKLGLLEDGLRMLADQLREQDRVAIVAYAGASGVVLEPTNDRRAIHRALRRLRAGGSTAGAAGLNLAYEVAQRNFDPTAINRVILASDGDFNVGPSSQGELVDLIEQWRETGVFLSVLGFGTGNLNDAMMEQIADHGNGNYAYIDSVKEARRVLVDQANATLVPIAKDVKLQIELNPAVVEAYRLIGYENRILDAQDFNDDRKDAGEIGAGHSVTALYEIIPAGTGEVSPRVDALRYQSEPTPEGSQAEADPAPAEAAPAPAEAAPAPELAESEAAPEAAPEAEPASTIAESPTEAPLAIARTETWSDETMFVKIRYKAPDGDTSQLVEIPVNSPVLPLDRTSANFRFSAAVAAFGMLLRDSEHRGDATFARVTELARGALGADPDGLRQEFVAMVERAAELRR